MAATDILRAHIEPQSTQTICEALALLDLLPKKSMKPEERMVYAALCDVLEARFPHLDAALEAWVNSTDLNDDRSYAMVIFQNIPTTH